MAFFRAAKVTQEKHRAGDAAAPEKQRRAGTARGGTTTLSLVKQAWVTEKAGRLGTHGAYIFVVDERATKTSIASAIRKKYGVDVARVNTLRIKGKTKRLGRSTGKTASMKKAIVSLRKGQTIDVMPA